MRLESGPSRRCHELGRADGRAQGDESPLARRQVAAPDVGSEFRDPWRRAPASTAVYPRLSEVGGNPGQAFNIGGHQVKGCTGASRLGDDVQVIQVGREDIAWGQVGSGGFQCGALPEGKEGRRKRVSLFTAFGLADVVARARVIPPKCWCVHRRCAQRG